MAIAVSSRNAFADPAFTYCEHPHAADVRPENSAQPDQAQVSGLYPALQSFGYVQAHRD